MTVTEKAQNFLSYLGIADEFGPLGTVSHQRNGLIICLLDVNYKDAKKMIEKTTGITSEIIIDEGKKEYSFDYYGLGRIVCYRNETSHDCIAFYKN